MMNKRKFTPWILIVFGILLSLAGGLLIAAPVIVVGIVLLSKNAAPLRIFAYGTIVSAAILGVSLLFMNPPQCPDNYTQAQVDSSSCIIGANIGLGLALMLAAGIWGMTILVSLTRYVLLTIDRNKRNKQI